MLRTVNTSMLAEHSDIVLHRSPVVLDDAVKILRKTIEGYLDSVPQYVN